MESESESIASDYVFACVYCDVKYEIVAPANAEAAHESFPNPDDDPSKKRIAICDVCGKFSMFYSDDETGRLGVRKPTYDELEGMLYDIGVIQTILMQKMRLM